MSDSLPPDGWRGGVGLSDLQVVGKPPMAAGERPPVVWRMVTPDYFRALQIPMVAGRNFSEQERKTDAHFAILSKALAAMLFPAGDAVGQRIERAVFVPYRQPGPVYTVVGVAGNVKNAGLSGKDQPEFYELRSSVRADDWNDHHFFLIESSLPAAVIAPWIRARVKQLDPTAPVEIDTMKQTVSTLADRPRFEMALLGFFALCGMLMAVIGLYGVIAFVVAQRTQEIGVRMALGATRGNILRLIAGEGVRLIVIGGVVGIGGALAASQLLKSLLFGVGALDPWTYAAVVALLGVVALAATLLPALAAMKVDPMEALRYE
jgi:predicted permease